MSSVDYSLSYEVSEVTLASPFNMCYLPFQVPCGLQPLLRKARCQSHFSDRIAWGKLFCTEYSLTDRWACPPWWKCWLLSHIRDFWSAESSQDWARPSRSNETPWSPWWACPSRSRPHCFWPKPKSGQIMTTSDYYTLEGIAYKRVLHTRVHYTKEGIACC